MKRTLFFVFTFLIMATAVVHAGYEWDVYVQIGGGHKATGDYTYEGHNYSITDASTFNLGTTDQALSHRDILVATQNGFVTNSFAGTYDHFALKRWAKFASNVTGEGNATVSKYNVLEASVIFDKPGPASVTLTETWEGSNNPKRGQTNSVTKSLTVRACPYLDSFSIGGTQRAFQRQVITAHIAQNPKYPIVNYGITVDGSNSRPLQINRSDEFIDLSFEFITKNSAKKTYTYAIWAEDSRGEKFYVTGNFTVAADQAPNAFIKINEPLYRSFKNEKGELVAQVIAESNGKLTDDPVEYTWVLPSEAENVDLSDASSRKFTLKNVGYYYITLKVKDVWKDTLPEFVSDSDRKEASYTYKFAVNNKRPTVSLSNIKRNSLELLLINPGDTDLNLIANALSDANIDAEIKLANYAQTQTPGIFSLVSAIPTQTPYSNLLAGGRCFQGAVVCDDNYVYKFVSSKPTKTNTSLAPFDIYRFDKNDLTIEPSILTIPAEKLAGANTTTTEHTFSQDLKGNYLVASIGQKSVIVEKKTNKITAVSTHLGVSNVSVGGYLYSATEAGLIKVDLSNGSFETVLTNECLSPKVLQQEGMKIFHGYAVFVIKDGNSLSLAKLNLSTGQILKTPLVNSSVSTEDSIIGISSSGRFVIEQITSSEGYIRTWILDGSRFGPDIKKAKVSSVPTVVYNCSGEINYAFEAYNPTSTTNAYYLYDLATATSTKKTSTKKTNTSLTFVGLEFDDSSVLTFTGAQFTSGKATKYCFPISFGTGAASDFESNWDSASDLKNLELAYRNNDTFIFSYGAGSYSYSYIYEFSMPNETKVDNIKNLLLTGGKDFQKVIDLSKESFNLQAIINECAPHNDSGGNEIKHFEIGEKPSYNFVYSDPEGDPIGTTYCSMDLNKTLTKAGTYSFDYYAIDNCGSDSFNKKSNVLHVTFTVGDIEIDPEPEKVRVYRLHRKY
ncbi:MAG: hypothetical protein Q4F55_03270 [Bacillota bacterium]|nr:hypothetical protein [Bacillota bacterium]